VERALITAHDDHAAAVAAPGGAPGLGRHEAIFEAAAPKAGPHVAASSHSSSSLSDDASTLSNGSSSSSVDEVASF